MYNNGVTTGSYEIRKCGSCGLRYPLVEGNPHGRRCPACAGETRRLLSRKLIWESRSTPAPPSLSADASLEKRGELAVLLDNVRSALNVGSILRSADGFRLAHAFLCGITPTPDGSAGEAVRKTSLGAEDWVPWSYHKDGEKLAMGLKKEGWKILALEDDSRAIDIDLASTSAGDNVLIVGNEVTGVDPELLDLCDQIFYIPMRGGKKSFNVAVAFGIAAFTLR